MDQVAAARERLCFAVHALPRVLKRITEAESEQSPSPERWSRKDVVGHLIDSAANNHVRFVRGQLATGQDFPRYDQEGWVRVQHYQRARWNDLIELWRAYNAHLIHVGACMSAAGQGMSCSVGGGDPVTVAALFVDYVDHLEHHLRRMLGRWDCPRWERRQLADLTPAEETALQALSLAVYPPEVAAPWPGRAYEWSSALSSVIGWDGAGAALCYVGLHLRTARWNERSVKIGGIGGVKTHPSARAQGFAGFAIQRALDFFRGEEVDLGLLVCEPGLIPFYERLGWRRFEGTLFVTQKQATVPFTFNVPMTVPIRVQEKLGGTIDLLGPPW
jgi:hypothetical protein